MLSHRSVEELLAEVRAHPIEGWDFGWLRAQGRYHEDEPPWNYDSLVEVRSRGSPDLLDLGTGGGERLATFRDRPPRTVATESFLPNLRVAARRLHPLGVQVIRTSAAPENVRLSEQRLRGRLPFRDRAFHLIIDRNESFVPSEVARVLDAGGTFLTEQTGSNEIPIFARLLDLPPHAVASRPWTLEVAREQLTKAGLSVGSGQEAEFELRLDDIGALAWYLTAVPWAAPGFSVARARGRLEELNRTVSHDDPIRVPRYGFWLEAHRD